MSELLKARQLVAIADSCVRRASDMLRPDDDIDEDTHDDISEACETITSASDELSDILYKLDPDGEANDSVIINVVNEAIGRQWQAEEYPKEPKELTAREHLIADCGHFAKQGFDFWTGPTVMDIDPVFHDELGHIVGYTIVCTTGGPQIHLDTAKEKVIGRWRGVEPAEISVDKTLCRFITEFYQETE